MRFLILLLIIAAASGCGNRNIEELSIQSERITEGNDGSIVLHLKEAYLLQDSIHPDMNTAEWAFSISHKGRYELWLSSFTKDTMDLDYQYPVIIHFQDKKIQARPIGNEIVLDTPDTGGVYYRADSRLGSVYIEEPGDYNIQIVSAKVISNDLASDSDKSHTQLKSLILKPMTD